MLQSILVFLCQCICLFVRVFVCVCVMATFFKRICTLFNNYSNCMRHRSHIVIDLFRFLRIMSRLFEFCNNFLVSISNFSSPILSSPYSNWIARKLHFNEWKLRNILLMCIYFVYKFLSHVWSMACHSSIKCFLKIPNIGIIPLVWFVLIVATIYWLLAFIIAWHFWFRGTKECNCNFVEFRCLLDSTESNGDGGEWAHQ